MRDAASAGSKRPTAASESANDAGADQGAGKRARTDVLSPPLDQRPGEGAAPLACSPTPSPPSPGPSSRVHDCLLTAYRLASQAQHATCAEMLALVGASLPAAGERLEPARLVLAVVAGMAEAAASEDAGDSSGGKRAATGCGVWAVGDAAGLRAAFALSASDAVSDSDDASGTTPNGKGLSSCVSSLSRRGAGVRLPDGLLFPLDCT